MPKLGAYMLLAALCAIGGSLACDVPFWHMCGLVLIVPCVVGAFGMLGPPVHRPSCTALTNGSFGSRCELDEGHDGPHGYMARSIHGSGQEGMYWWAQRESDVSTIDKRDRHEHWGKN